MNRRDFLKSSAATMAGAILTPAMLWGASENSNPIQSLNFFTKPLQWMNYDQLAESVAKMGLDGFDLTVRPQGHVLPENVERDLPKAVKAAEAQGIKVDMMVTAIQSADEKLAERVLKTAAQNGVRVYRMGYLRYDTKKSVEDSLSDIGVTMAALEKLNQKAQLTGCYQNHYAWKPGLFGGAVWDLHYVLKNIDPQWLGCQYDVRHAIAECTGSWSTGTRLIAPWIKSICLKDFNFKSDQKRRSHPRSLPAGQGLVPWKDYLELLRDLRVSAPATVHIEWDFLNKKEKKLPAPQRTELAIARIKAECDFYKKAFELN